MNERLRKIFAEAEGGFDGAARIRTDRVSERTHPKDAAPVRRLPVAAWDSDEFDAYDAFDLDEAA
ncbi:hypothetical protein [Amycolatopsis tolypomycina]|uniref:hypothetical protein n=1 Tax=Amycolatopsis tolypomycina TaxID=208445 RepID=UPI0033BE8103